jgi:geranylgeranyl pyrophosphate synthase
MDMFMASVDQIVPETQSEIVLKAKSTLKSFVQTIDEKLNQYFAQELTQSFGVSDKEKELSHIIWSHLQEHALRPAKRIRGSFVYYGYLLFGGKDIDAILHAAMSIELIHTALLIHDDFMDQDVVRRGLPTTHVFFKDYHVSKHFNTDAIHYGHSMAVDTGDIALLAGHQILAESKFPDHLKLRALSRLLRGIVNTGFGQAYDVTLEASRVATEADILSLHHAKTGIYTYENPLHIGAILAGATEDDLALLTEYATPGGIAFQLQDDILGLYGDEEKTGKSSYSDIREGKATLLILKALELSNPTQKNILQELWGKNDITEKEAQKVRTIITDTGSLAYSKDISISYAQEAKAVTSRMREKDWNREAIDYLDGIAQYMVERDL